MKVLLFLTFFSMSSAHALSIYDTKNKQYISEAQLNHALPHSGQIVLGEYHYQDSIQKAQGHIIKSVIESKALQDTFSVAWEFLDYPNQENIAINFNKFKNDRMTDKNLLTNLFSESRNPNKNIPYLHFLKATKNLNGEVLGSNAPRSWKSLITKSGLSSLDPKLIPPAMELGTKHYLARFKTAMGQHIPADKLQNYYEAQCYTDSVMAWSMQELGSYELKFLIVGSFHSDYNDGVVKQLKRYSSLPTVNIKIVDTTDMSQVEIQKELITPHPTYGTLADYLYLID